MFPPLPNTQLNDSSVVERREAPLSFIPLGTGERHNEGSTGPQLLGASAIVSVVFHPSDTPLGRMFSAVVMVCHVSVFVLCSSVKKRFIK